MKTALLFGFFEQSIYPTIINNSKGTIQYAADALQKAILKGLALQNKDITIINLPYIGSYPSRYKKLYSPYNEFKYSIKGNSISGTNVRFCNLTIYKMYSRYYNSKKAILNWCNKYPNDHKILIIYAIHSPFLSASLAAKQKYPNLKIIQIVPDLPEFMDSKSSLIKRALKNIERRKLNNSYKKIDGFVLLSKYMASKLNIKDKPYTVVEGIFDNTNNSEILRAKPTNTKKILYTGTLAKRYGILNLLNAFSTLSNPNYQLIICGGGDTQEYIKECTIKDSRIIYKGQLNREEILKLQQQANLLINPRTPEGEFTKYSFPSKTMEYLASGIPTLLYKLDGIPDEYYNYCFYLEDTSIPALAKKIDEILNMDNDLLTDLGTKAKNFILSKKDPVTQTRKIFNLITSLN